MAIASNFSDRVAEMSQTRAGCAVSGAALIAFGLLTRGKPMTRGLSSLAGAGLLYHAWTGRIPFAESAANIGANLEPMLVSDSIQVRAGRDSTYRFWRNVQNLPAITERVERVEEFDHRRSRWTVRTAQGQVVSWTSEITDDDPGKAIYWRSLDSPVRHEGVVRFDDVPGDDLSTRVSLEMRYMLPSGLRGKMARQALGDPQQDLQDDLQRLKRILERENFMMAAPPAA